MSTPTPQQYKVLPDDSTRSAPLVVAELTQPSTQADGQVSVTTAATQIVAARSDRKGLVVINRGSSIVSLHGDNTVATTNLRLYPGETFRTAYTGALWGIVPGGAAASVVDFWEDRA